MRDYVYNVIVLRKGKYGSLFVVIQSGRVALVLPLPGAEEYDSYVIVN
jgi:hypothetical protein